MSAYAIAGLALCLLCVASMIPSAWVNARRKLDLLLDAEADAATPEFDRLSMEFFDAALDDDGKGRWTA